MASYNKEVTEVIDSGLPPEAAVQLYQILTDHFDNISCEPELIDFRQTVLNKRKYRRGEFHKEIDEVCGKYPLPVTLTWRKVKYEPKRIKVCAVCSDYFYDVGRNGRKLTCYNNVCDKEYERRRKRPGTIIDPVYYRKVEEVPIDFLPTKDKVHEHALLNTVEMTVWRDKTRKI